MPEPARAAFCLLELILTTTIALTTTPHTLCPRLWAQTASTADWREAIQWLDSDSAADWTAAEDILRQSSASGSLPPEACGTMALFRLRQQAPLEALAQVTGLAQQHTPEQLEPTRALVLRVQLAAALASQQDSLAAQAFKDLVRMIVAAQADPLELQLSAHCLGTVVGMLSSSQAQAPITQRDLEIARQCLLDSKVPKVVATFSQAEAHAYEQTQELERQLVLIAKHGLDSQTAVYQAQEIRLRQEQSELAEQKELTGETLRNAKEMLAQNIRDRRKLEQQIYQLQVQLRQPTPGHPGPKRTPPATPPSRTSIVVDEYELRTEYESISQAGKTVVVPVTRQVRRPLVDINRQRDEIYQSILREYDQASRDYQQYLRTYEQALKSWNEIDRARRDKLTKDKTQAEAQRDALLAESQAIQADKASVAKDMVTARTAQEQERFEWTMLGLALTAAKTQTLASLFRPPHYELLRWSQEKASLQRHTR